MTQTQAPDPFAEALDPKQPPQTVFGQILFDLYFCALIKGQGKVQFDPTQHNARQRRTCIKLDIVPLPETGRQWDISREFIAEIRSDGWLQVTLPSLREVGVDDLKAMNEQYVKAELVTYGSYTKKNGSEGDLSAPKILAVYADRESCLKAWETEEPDQAAATDLPGFEKDETLDEINDTLYGPESNGKPVNEGTRKVALNFLPGIVKGCKKGNNMDLEMLAQKLKETPLIKDHFTMESPEVLAEVEKALADPAF